LIREKIERKMHSNRKVAINILNQLFKLIVFVSTISYLCVHATAKESCPPPYSTCNLGKAGYINVHLVPHTHNDVGWLKTVDQYYYGTNNVQQDAAVQYILDTVIDELNKDPNRRFVYVEMAYLWRWWNEQDHSMKQIVRSLVNEGRLEFVIGAW
jgi:lysosomal alpha-mannosidase